MTPNRNDPCPCGSGRKYKRCCGSAARRSEEEAEAREGVRAVARSAEAWEADALPLRARIADGSSPRPVAVVVVADDLVIHTDILGRLAGEAEAVAGELERAVATAARACGAYPPEVRVRHGEVAAALAPLLQPRDISVRAVRDLPELEQAGRALLEEFGGGPDPWPPTSATETWSAWDLPPRLVAEVFSAAAGFWRAAPWRHAANLQAPRVRLPSGREWTACILGNAGEEFGLALYSDAWDLFEGMAGAEPWEAFSWIRGSIVSVTFERTSDMSRRARREARRAGWELADPAAYPWLMTVNTPGGGVSRQDVEDLVAILRASPGFVERHALALLREEREEIACAPIEWRHEDSGLLFRYAGEAVAAVRRAAEVDLEPPEHLREALEEILAEGLAEDPDEVIAQLNERLGDLTATHNRTPQAELGGLSPAEVHRLLRADWMDPDGPIRLNPRLPPEQAAAPPFPFNVRALLELAVERGALGATQAGNLKLAVVAELFGRLRFEPLDRLVIEREKGRRREEDLRPLHLARVVAELGGLLDRTTTRFLATERGRELLDPARAGELYAHLFETYFCRFNLDYTGWWEWPELQAQLAYTLYRLGQVAGEWRTAEELAEEVVLLFARERAPTSPHLDLAPRLLGGKALEPLVGFGLVEAEASPGAGDVRTPERYRITPLFDAFLRFDLEEDPESPVHP